MTNHKGISFMDAFFIGKLREIADFGTFANTAEHVTQESKLQRKQEARLPMEQFREIIIRHATAKRLSHEQSAQLSDRAAKPALGQDK